MLINLIMLKEENNSERQTQYEMAWLDATPAADN
jgi:hypothetical protein